MARPWGDQCCVTASSRPAGRPNGTDGGLGPKGSLRRWPPPGATLGITGGTNEGTTRQPASERAILPELAGLQVARARSPGAAQAAQPADLALIGYARDHGVTVTATKLERWRVGLLPPNVPRRLGRAGAARRSPPGEPATSWCGWHATPVSAGVPRPGPAGVRREACPFPTGRSARPSVRCRPREASGDGRDSLWSDLPCDIPCACPRWPDAVDHTTTTSQSLASASTAPLVRTSSSLHPSRILEVCEEHDGLSTRLAGAPRGCRGWAAGIWISAVLRRSRRPANAPAFLEKPGGRNGLMIGPLPCVVD
jgi:hypothetical protein